MANEMLSAAILLTFVTLTLIGAATTLARALRYRRYGTPPPVLLGRDRDLLLGLFISFGAIAFVRAFELQDWAFDSEGIPHVWYVLVTGIPPIYAMARYCYYELFVIEKGRPFK